MAMTAEAINLIVLIGAISIVGVFGLIVVKVAMGRGGRPRETTAKPGRQHHRKVNPKTGALFP
jgi:hypothetical protein